MKTKSTIRDYIVDINGRIFEIILIIYIIFLFLKIFFQRIELINLEILQYVLIVSSILYIIKSKEIEDSKKNIRIKKIDIKRQVFYIILLPLLFSFFVYNSLIRYGLKISLLISFLTFLIIAISIYILSED